MNGLTAYGDLIRTTRESKGWNQRELARRLDRDPPFVSRLERGEGKIMPDPELLQAIRRTLGISMRSQLTSLGYLDADEPEPGVAYVIREGDPRIAMLRLMDGMAENRIANITRAFGIVADVSGETGRATDGDAHAGTG